MASDDSRRQAQARSRDVEGKGATARTYRSRNRGAARAQARRPGGGKSADRGGARRRRDLLHLRFGPLSERKGIRAGRRNLHVEGRVISLILWHPERSEGSRARSARLIRIARTRAE